MGMTIEERVEELRAARRDYEQGQFQFDMYADIAGRHMPAVLDALAAKDREIERLTDSRDSFREQFAAKKFECDDLIKRIAAAEKALRFFGRYAQARQYFAEYVEPDPNWCFICDRPQNDCACALEER